MTIIQKHLEVYGNKRPNDNLTYSESFKSKGKITKKNTNNDKTKVVKIIAPLKYLSNFWRTLEILLIVELISF